MKKPSQKQKLIIVALVVSILAAARLIYSAANPPAPAPAAAPPIDYVYVVVMGNLQVNCEEASLNTLRDCVVMPFGLPVKGIDNATNIIVVEKASE